MYVYISCTYIGTGKKRGRPKKEKSEGAVTPSKVQKVEKPSTPDIGIQ
jgi:hypothetical protein